MFHRFRARSPWSCKPGNFTTGWTWCRVNDCYMCYYWFLNCNLPKSNRKGSQTLNTGYIMMTSLLVSSSDLVIGATFVLIAWNSHLDLLNTLNTHFSNHFFGWIRSHLGHFSNRNHFLRRSAVSKPPWVTDVFFCHFRGLLDPGSSEQLPMGRHECRCRQYQRGAGGAGDGCDSWNM